MHIPDGIVPAQVCIAGYGTTGLLTWFSLRQIDRQGNSAAKVPKAALLTAAFFVASSIYIPIPPASVHLLLNGLLGVILGYFSFPAILIGLFFQALIVGHGGWTSLGVNATMM
ncbi:MAG: CbiM family transporter, partial [Cyanobacteria bacterium J06555_13]